MYPAIVWLFPAAWSESNGSAFKLTMNEATSWVTPCNAAHGFVMEARTWEVIDRSQHYVMSTWQSITMFYLYKRITSNEMRNMSIYLQYLNTLRPKQNGRRFPDDILKRIFLNENCLILMKISLKSIAKGPINHILALVQIMAWRRSGDKPLSEPMMVYLNDAYMRHSASMI